jgi:hypothetical protein
MTTILAHVLATLFVVAVGGGLLACLPRPDGPRHWAERLGTAYLLGAMLLSVELLAMGRFGHVGVATTLAANVPLALAALWRLGRARAAGQASLLGPPPLATSRERWAWWHWALAAGVGVKLAWVAVMNLSELRRTDDAFAYALALARHVFAERSCADFAMARDYPKCPGLLIVYFMLARGEWNEWTINLAYGNWLVALLAAFYGNLRASLPRGMALAATYALTAMPLFLNHAVMAGYADLPMAACLTLAGVYAYRWAREGGRDLLALAVAFALTLPLIKTEGLIPHGPIALWAILLAAGWRRGLRPELLWGATGMVALLGVAAAPVMAAIYGQSGPAWLPPDAWNRIRPENHLAQCWEPLLDHFGSYYNNWQIVGTLAALALAPLAWARRRRPESVIALFGLLELGAFLDLFALGGAFEFLQNSTTVNRLYLQILPVLLFGCATLLTDMLGLVPSPGHAPGASAARPARPMHDNRAHRPSLATEGPRRRRATSPQSRPA